MLSLEGAGAGLRAAALVRRSVLGVFLACGIAACGGGGGGDPAPAGPTTPVSQAPTASIAFPSKVSYTDADTLRIRGTASGPNGVASVSVNGVAASSSDGFAHWIAVVPVAAGSNTFVVTTRDAAGNSRSDADSVTVHNRGPSIIRLRSLALDAAHARVLAVDDQADAVYALRLTDGVASVLSSNTHGSGAEFALLETVVVDAARQRALVLDWGANSVVAVDLDTGDRTLVSAPSAVTGTGFSGGSTLALDPAGNRVFVTSGHTGGIIAVDLATGTRTVVSGPGVGTGAAFVFTQGIAYDDVTSPSVPRLLVSDSGAIVAVDVATGDRTVMSSGPGVRGTGIGLSSPAELKLDAASNRVLVADSGRNALVAIDLPTGNRTVLADAVTGTGALLAVPLALAHDSVANRVLVAPASGEIVQVNLATLARSTFAESKVGTSIGTGSDLLGASGMVLERQNGVPVSLLVSNSVRRAVARVDLATGNRSIVSSAAVGSGPALSRPADIVLDTRGGIAATQALVLDGGTASAIVSVNLATGARSLVASLNGSTPSVVAVRKLTLDAAANRVVFTDSSLDAVFSVNLGTGVRTLVSGLGTGSGLLFDSPSALVMDAITNPSSPRLLVGDFLRDALVSVDSFGNRTLLTNYVAGLRVPSPNALTLDPANRRVLVADTLNMNLMSVDLATGNHVQISGGNYYDPNGPIRGTGPALFNPSAMDVDFAGQVAYVLSSSRQAVIAVDLVTGDRVIMSR
jgi:sugar lactone lactonase YvrE